MNIQYRIHNLNHDDMLTFIQSEDMKKNFNIISTEPDLLLKEKRNFVDRRTSIKVKFNINLMKDIEYLTVKIISFGNMIFIIAIVILILLLCYIIFIDGSISDFIHNPTQQMILLTACAQYIGLIVISKIQEDVTRQHLREIIRKYFSQPDKEDKLVL